MVDRPVSPVLFLPKLTNYAGGFIVSKKAIETAGYERFRLHPVGTGPFAFRKYEKGSKLELRAHDKYFRGKARLAGVEIHFQPEMTERERVFANNELDVIIGSAKPGRLKQMEKTPGVMADTFGVGEMAVFFLNSAIPPFNALLS